MCKYQPGSPNDVFAKERNPIFDIYKEDSGLIPNYAGHVPGSDFRFVVEYSWLLKTARTAIFLYTCNNKNILRLYYFENFILDLVKLSDMIPSMRNNG